MRHPFLEGLRPTLHIAHRGGALLAPENTLVAFQAAVERWRTDMLELDVHATRDGELVVSHDPTIQRCTDGHGRIAEHTLAELQALDAGFQFSPDGGRTFPFRAQGVRLPSFREVLRAFPGLRLNVEVKSEAPGIEAAVASMLRAEGAVNRVCLGSELDPLAERLVEAAPEVCAFYPRDALTSLVLALKSGETPPDDPRYQVLDMPLDYGEVRLVDGPFLEATTRIGRWVNVWTVDQADTMRELVGLRVGGIMTDRPDLLRAVLG
ncbi:MAG TPA: glycerophosphodiester phosphodiesterase [Myxococcaceae bacterium]|nr:glycerophosphodiester phosphodiesterase [Myxococcaceae bacterium]